MRLGRKIISGLLVCAGLLLAAFAAGPAQAQDEDFCRAYSYAAIEAAKAHFTNQCGGDENGRYSLDLGFHYNTCMGWGGEAMKWATRETNIRSQAFYNCKAQKAGVAAFDLGHTEYENEYPRPGDKFGFCSNYAFWVAAQRAAASRQPCNLSGLNGRWDESFNFHRDWCMGLAPQDAFWMSVGNNDRAAQTVQCQAEVALANNQSNAIQLEEEMRVTGKTIPECQSSNQRCEARAIAMGALNSPGIIATECAPRLQVCIGNAVAELTKDETDDDPDEDVRTVGANGTTVYEDENATKETGDYLEAGQQVTVVGCPNWSCQISAPVEGFVDGGDLE